MLLPDDRLVPTPEQLPEELDPAEGSDSARAPDSHARLRLLRAEMRSEEASVLYPVPSLARGQSTEGRTLISELAANRPLGAYVSGLPGVGKSTFLLHLILDDIRAGRSCCVLDPHGDLISAVLARCPAEDPVLDRIVLFDPSDVEWPIGLNLLDAGTERERDLAVQFMIDVFEELFLPDHQGPMLHQSIRNGMRLLMETGGSLAELPVLFSDADFLKGKLKDSQDPWARHYFESVWLEVKGSSRGEYLAYFTSKLSCFLDDSLLRNILGQRTGLDLPAILNAGGVLLADLSRGALGDRDSRLLGMILLHKLERLALERAAARGEPRCRIHIYLDEFDDLVTTGLKRFLAAARKFEVGLTLAHQRLELLHPAMREAILGSTGHVILFRQGGDDGFRGLARLVWPRFGEKELFSVPNHQALVRVTRADGTMQLGRVRVPPPGIGDDCVAAEVRSRTRARLAQPRRMVEGEILRRLGWNDRSEERNGTPR